MNKLCCFPFSQQPNVAVKFACVSACCASEMKHDGNDEHDNKRKKESDVDSIRNIKLCCCGRKRSFFKKTHAKEKGNDEEKDEIKND